MSVEISHSKVDSIALVSLRGTIVAGKDTEIVASKLEELLEAGEKQIVLDLGEVTFIDSAGISALVKAYTLAERKGGKLKLLHLTKRIHEVLQITRLSSVFEIFDDLRKAVASFANGAEGGGPPPAGS
jgi:anti-sigma B factor antagonist